MGARTQRMSWVEIAVLGTRGLALGPASATTVSLWASLVTPLDLRVPLYKTGLGKWQSQRPLPKLQSVFLGVLRAHPHHSAPPRLIGVGSAGWAGWNHQAGLAGTASHTWVPGSAPPGEAAISASPQHSTVSWLLDESQELAEYGDLHRAPKGRSGPAQERRIRDLSWDG